MTSCTLVGCGSQHEKETLLFSCSRGDQAFVWSSNCREKAIWRLSCRVSEKSVGNPSSIFVQTAVVAGTGVRPLTQQVIKKMVVVLGEVGPRPLVPKEIKINKKILNSIKNQIPSIKKYKINLKCIKSITIN